MTIRKVPLPPVLSPTDVLRAGHYLIRMVLWERVTPGTMKSRAQNPTLHEDIEDAARAIVMLADERDAYREHFFRALDGMSDAQRRKRLRSLKRALPKPRPWPDWRKRVQVTKPSRAARP
jgi:hypothetical protein